MKNFFAFFGNKNNSQDSALDKENSLIEPTSNNPPPTSDSLPTLENEAIDMPFSISSGVEAVPNSEAESNTSDSLHSKIPEPTAASPNAPYEPAHRKRQNLLEGSDGEHKLQEKYGSRSRAVNFYEKQMLDYLAPKMKEFIARQEFLFVATSDRNGECDNTSKFGKPGFIRVLGDRYLMYPEYRGNGVYANSGNLSENPHIAMLRSAKSILS